MEEILLPTQIVFRYLRGGSEYFDQAKLYRESISDKKLIDMITGSAYDSYYFDRFITLFDSLEQCQKYLYERIGKQLLEESQIGKENFRSGVILNGEFLKCNSQSHRTFIPFLYRIGLVNYIDETSDEIDANYLKVSSNQMCSANAYVLSNTESYPSEHMLSSYYNRLNLNELDIRYLFNHPEISIYSHEEQVSMCLFYYLKMKYERLGSKYQSIKVMEYLKTLLGLHYEIPYISSEYFPLSFLRSSPATSRPGLYSSIRTTHYAAALSHIQEQEQYKEEKDKDNELHWFYQKYIPGSNGVCTVIGGEVYYDISENQGDLVNNYQFSSLKEKYSSLIEQQIAEIRRYLNFDFQIEFVISNGVFYLVQFRVLEDTIRYNEYSKDYVNALKAKTFCSGNYMQKGIGKVNKKDILVVNDGEEVSDDVVKNAKLVIFNSEKVFAHCLALSHSYYIPSCFAPENFEELFNKLPEKNINFDFKGKIAWLYE